MPDEETAKKIADIIINKHRPEGSYIADEYEVKIEFNESEYVWELYYSPIPPEGYDITGGGTSIKIRKDCGMIVDMYFTK